MKVRKIGWRRPLLLLVVAALSYVAVERFDRPAAPGAARPSSASALDAAIRERASGIQVRGEGEVVRLLSDDRDGSRHQRFVLRLPSGRTVLVSHNIDLAPRLAGLEVGDLVRFHGVYEWNERGGLVHWTHHDPDGRHEAGWLEHRGKRSS